MVFSSWLKGFLTAEDITKIEAAIARVETATSGEVVPMVVRRSSTVGHVPIVLYLLGMLLYYLAGVPEIQAEYLESSWWLIIVWIVVLVPVVRYLSAQLWIQALLVTRVDRQSQAEMRAETEFYEAGLTNTDGSTGILLFLSLLERHAVVLADKGIAQKLPPETWKHVVQLMVDGAKKRNLAEGLCQAIDQCGEILAQHFPIKPNDTNELPNKLIIKE